MAKYYFSLLSTEVKPRIRNIYWKFRKIIGKEFNFRIAALCAVWSLHFGSTEYFPAVIEDWQKHTEEVSLGLTNLNMSVYDCVTEKKEAKVLYPDVDMNLSYMKTHRVPISLVRDTILENPGYLPFVEYVKKAYPKADAQWKQLATQIDEVVYPLTARLLAM
nr:hypothetical protein Cplu_431 [Cedratvirus plubellavi]